MQGPPASTEDDEASIPRESVVKPWVIYFPPPRSEYDEASIPSEYDEASIPMEDDKASNPMEDEEASMLMEHVRNGPHLSAGTRKVAKRTFPWDLRTTEIDPALPPPQDEEVRDTKRPRLERLFPASTYGATTAKTDTSSVTNTHQNAMSIRTRRRWILEEDAKLTCAATKTRKKNWGKKSITNWAAIAALVSDRTQVQCRKRWHDTLVFNIDPATARTHTWISNVSMQGPPNPTKDDEASVLTKHVRKGPRSIVRSRKVARRAYPWKLTAEKIEPVVLPPQHDLRGPFPYQHIKLLLR
jgi:hypothetical protein